MFSAKKGVLAAVALAALGFSAAASADVVTAKFDVKITIQKACIVTAAQGANDINFGTVSALIGADQLANNSASKVTVQCSKTTPYNIGLTPSNNNHTGAGLMTGPDALGIAYQLRSTAGIGGTVWGDTIGTNTVSGTGATAVPYTTAYTVYATIAAAALNVTPGAYIDPVTVTVTY